VFHSESIGKVAAALSTAQVGFKPIARDKTVRVKSQRTGQEYTFSYAPLETIMAAVREALGANRLALTQSVVVDAQGHEQLRTLLIHESGEFLANHMPILVAERGAQAYGSAVTYARRYGITQLLCITADDDDDANAAEGNDVQRVQRRPAKSAEPKVETVSGDDLKALLDKVAEVGADPVGFAKFLGVATLEQLPAKQLTAAMSALDAKARKAKAKAEVAA
jgi:hypothetical protein